MKPSTLQFMKESWTIHFFNLNELKNQKKSQKSNKRTNKKLFNQDEGTNERSKPALNWNGKDIIINIIPMKK